MSHDTVLGMGSVLDGKMLGINVARQLSWATVADHIDSRHIIFIKRSGTMLWVSNLEKDSTNIFSTLGWSNCSKKLSFHTGCGSSGLSFRETWNNAKGEEESIASHRTRIQKISTRMQSAACSAPGKRATSFASVREHRTVHAVYCIDTCYLYIACRIIQSSDSHTQYCTVLYFTVHQRAEPGSSESQVPGFDIY